VHGIPVGGLQILKVLVNVSPWVLAKDPHLQQNYNLGSALSLHPQCSQIRTFPLDVPPYMGVPLWRLATVAARTQLVLL